MKGFLSHYTPSLMNPEDLDAIFVQRDRLLTDLLENIENSILTETKHHALLIGPRGIGKTHLISMIYHRVSVNEVFQDKLKIAWLREEEWGIATFLDLLVRILNSLMEEYKDKNLGIQVKDLYSVSTEQAEQLAGHILKKYCQDKTLLLLMENLDEIFKGLDESGQQAFRAYLQNYGFITIVATSQSLFKGVQSRNLPFYGFFSPTHLKPLVLEEAIALLVNIAKWRGDQDLADLLITPLGKSRIRAIHHLAGGNHRIYIIFSQFLTTESLDSLVEPFMKTLDDLTPFYQSRMQFISPQQRKIIEYLCEQRGAIAVKEIAQHCFISPQTASSQLKQLRDMGYVYADSQGRESFYELQEPLMRICLEAKKRRGTPNQLFISFLRVWFSREELENRLEILPLDAIFDRKCTLQALEEMETSDDPKIAALLRDWNNASEKADREKMLEISEEFIQLRGSGLDWIRKAESCYWLGKKDDSLQALDKAVKIAPENAEVWRSKGVFEDRIGLFKAALKSLKISVEIDPNEFLTWSAKAVTEAKMSLEEESYKSLNFALLKSGENSIIVLVRAADIYRIFQEYDKALEYINKALEIESEYDDLWRSKVDILNCLNRSNDALECAEKAVELNPNRSNNYMRLAHTLFQLKKYKDALKAINASIQIHKFDSRSWGLKTLILVYLSSFEEAFQCFKECLKIEEMFPKSLSHTYQNNDFSKTLNVLLNKLLPYIFKLGKANESWLQYNKLMFKRESPHNLLDLSGGLVESIKAINEPSTSDHTAQAWLEMWQNVAGKYDEFQVALNLLKVAVEYKINRDRRVLLQLPQEERQILEELLNPETV